MYVYFSKILPIFVTPIGIILELLLVVLFLLWKRKRKSAATLLVAAMLMLWVASMPIVADHLLGRLEQQYPPVAMNDIPASECIVVLGGAVEPVRAPRVDVELNAAADRVYKAAGLYVAGRGGFVIAAGGNQPWSPYQQSEAEAIRQLLMEWGVPDSAIMLDRVSRNTRENVVNTWEIIQKRQCTTPLLVTSAAHMARSVASFEMVGIRVFPVPVDVRVVQVSYLTVFDFLPDIDDLQKTTDAMHEWVGQAYYRLRGWN